jgi:hypothetical protein
VAGSVKVSGVGGVVGRELASCGWLSGSGGAVPELIAAAAIDGRGGRWRGQQGLRAAGGVLWGAGVLRMDLAVGH